MLMKKTGIVDIYQFTIKGKNNVSKIIQKIIRI